MNDGPLIVQSDKTLLLEVDHPSAAEARKAIAPFAELERSPEHIHTYRLTPLGLWNARAAGHDAEQVVDAQGSGSQRVVQPVSLAGGFLQGWDERRRENRTFAVHRITSVALVEDDEAQAASS